MKTAQIEHYQREFENKRHSLPGVDTPWFNELRRKGINRFSEVGFPERRAEDWKYTDLSMLVNYNYATTTDTPSEIDEKEIKRITGQIDAECTLVLVNGRFSAIIGNPDPKGITIESMANVISEKPGVVRDFLSEYPEAMTAFESLNTAFMVDGIYLNAEKGAWISKPVQIVYLTTSQPDHIHHSTRNLLLFGENSHVNLVERYLSFESVPGYLNNTVSQIMLKQGAVVEHVKIQDEDPQAFHLSVQRVSQERDSSFSSYAFSVGALLSRNDIKVDLLGTDASCILNGLFLADGFRQSDNYTSTEHRVANCRSSEQYKGILDERGKGVFRGKIKVHQDAQKSDARLNNTNLLLSQTAEVDTMPQLEIYADDVKCSHGSGSGQLDSEQLFYLTSRGIDPSIAHALLVFGFANSTLEGIQSESIKKYLKDLLISKLSAHNEIKELV